MTSTSVLTVRTRVAGAMGGIAAEARVMHVFEDNSIDHDTVSFVQPTGACGPVYVLLGSEQVRVEDGSRFGEVLSPAWVERFYADC